MVINDAPTRPNRVRTSLSPDVRYALHALGADKGWHTQPDQVRECVMAGLLALGWDPSRINLEYLRYKVTCAEHGEANVFEPDA